MIYGQLLMTTMNDKTTKMMPSQALNRPITRNADENATAFQSQAQVTRRLGFQVSNLGLLIGQQATSELTELVEVCSIPFTADWLVGLINLRGNLVPIFDLHKLLQFEKQSQKKQMLLILGQGEEAGAIVIDDLPKHITVADNDKLNSLPPLPPIIQPYASIGYEKNGQLWFNFDHLGFFESLAAKLAL